VTAYFMTTLITFTVQKSCFVWVFRCLGSCSKYVSCVSHKNMPLFWTL